jgi:hypothetical protein
LFRKKWTVSGHQLGKNCAEFARAREVVRPGTHFDLLLITADQETPRKCKNKLDEEAGDVDGDGDSQETTALTTTEVI